MSKRNVYLCGVPDADCTGSKIMTDQQLPTKTPKAHNDPSEAFRCYCKYLKTQGYVQIGSREFLSPEDSPHKGTVLVLTKQSRFGGRLRKGKGEDKVDASRFMPYGKHTRGVIF